MNATDNPEEKPQRPLNYWRLWLLNTTALGAALLFFLTTQYGTHEFLWAALIMGLIPFIPTMLFVAGVGSAIFVAVKIRIERHGWRVPFSLALLVVPALLVALLVMAFGIWGSLPRQRLGYVCLGKAPATASHIQVTGYSAFLNGQWLATFSIAPTGFQELTTQAKLQPDVTVDFNRLLKRSELNQTRLFQNLPPLTNALCFQRVFKEKGERERGGIYAVFDSATGTARVFRAYHD